MSDRPTPEQIANALDVALQPLGGTGATFDRVEWLRDRLRSGAVIVHPDDVPEEWEYTDDQLMYQSHAERAVFSDGYRVCRSLIFGGQP